MILVGAVVLPVHSEKNSYSSCSSGILNNDFKKVNQGHQSLGFLNQGPKRFGSLVTSRIVRGLRDMITDKEIYETFDMEVATLPAKAFDKIQIEITQDVILSQIMRNFLEIEFIIDGVSKQFLYIALNNENTRDYRIVRTCVGGREIYRDKSLSKCVKWIVVNYKMGGVEKWK